MPRPNTSQAVSARATPGKLELVRKPSDWTVGSRASLVDAAMEQPAVQDSSRLEATVPLGDAESLERLRERTNETVTRSAGSTALVDADIPPVSHDEPGQEP